MRGAFGPRDARESGIVEADETLFLESFKGVAKPVPSCTQARRCQGHCMEQAKTRSPGWRCTTMKDALLTSNRKISMPAHVKNVFLPLIGTDGPAVYAAFAGASGGHALRRAYTTR